MVLVLGGEGRRFWNLVGQSCDDIVRIGNGGVDTGEMDSLKVIVVAGAALFYTLYARGG